MNSKQAPPISLRMKAVRRSNTSCEKVFEELLVEIGVPYCKQVRLRKCRPDFVIPGEKIAIFVDGDFWHGRVAVESGFKVLSLSFRGPTKRFWIDKITRNVKRDRRQTMKLRRDGWSVFRIWEKDLLNDASGIIAELEKRLKRRRAKTSLRPSDL